MASMTLYEYAVTEKLTGPPLVYQVKGAATTSGLVDGQRLGSGDEFVFNDAVFTYVGGADTETGEVGFFATDVAGATKFFSLSAVPAKSAYVLESDQTDTVPPGGFARATRIATPAGETAVEDLKVGDRVTVVVNGGISEQPVTWIGHRTIALGSHPRPETARPIRIKRDAFADNVPQRDVLVSPDQAVFVDGKLIRARQLVNGTTIRQEGGLGSVEYVCVEVDAHAILLSEGLPAGSYLNTGNQGFFAEPSCAPLVSDESPVRPIWQRLADRAAAVGQPVPAIEVATDPKLCIVVHDKTLHPLHARDGVYQFMLPPEAGNVRVISRAAAPADVRPWSGDRRRLGVRVERIVLRCANDLTEVPVDHPALSLGWWDVEHNGVELRRWTDGDAVLQLPVVNGPAVLELRATTGGMEYKLSDSKGPGS